MIDSTHQEQLHRKSKYIAFFSLTSASLIFLTYKLWDITTNYIVRIYADATFAAYPQGFFKGNLTGTLDIANGTYSPVTSISFNNPYYPSDGVADGASFIMGLGASIGYAKFFNKLFDYKTYQSSYQEWKDNVRNALSSFFFMQISSIVTASMFALTAIALNSGLSHISTQGNSTGYRYGYNDGYNFAGQNISGLNSTVPIDYFANCLNQSRTAVASLMSYEYTQLYLTITAGLLMGTFIYPVTYVAAKYCLEGLQRRGFFATSVSDEQTALRPAENTTRISVSSDPMDESDRISNDGEHDATSIPLQNMRVSPSN